MKILAIASVLTLSMLIGPICAAEVLVEKVKLGFESIEFREGSFPGKIKISLTVPDAHKFHPSMVAVNEDTVASMGASVKILERKDGYIRLQVEVDFGDCEHLMQSDTNWELAKVAGPEVSLATDQKFIPLIYFKHCMIGVGLGGEVIRDPIVQRWLRDAQESGTTESEKAEAKEAEQGVGEGRD